MSTLMSALPKEIAGLSRAAGGFIAKLRQLFIDGKWVAAASGKTFEVVNPATGEVVARVAGGDKEDVNRAVAAERAPTIRGSPERTDRPFDRAGR
jgi:hypothetical protein